MFKSVTSDVFIRRSARLITTSFNLSTATQALPEERLQIFRTKEDNPVKHDSNHLAQFYTLSPEDKNLLFSNGGLTKTFLTQAKTFNETCLMIRQPTIDVIECLKAADLSKPPARFVLYGKKGSGKSSTLAHLIHYAYKSNYLIVHVPWVGNWMRRCKESSNSETKEGYIDINIDAAAWLVHFKMQNASVLSNPELKTTKEHVWSKRESTPKGSSLNELIDHGISRIKFASDCIVLLSEEIKELSRQGKCKTFVAIDGFNAFFYPQTRIKTEKKEVVHPQKVVVTQGFLNLTQFDWKNAAIVLTVDELAIAPEDHISHLPRYLLGKEGFEHLDPFVPILVSNYSDKELKSCMEYYRDRKWVNPYPGQDDELSFLSANNPYSLMKLCSSL